MSSRVLIADARIPLTLRLHFLQLPLLLALGLIATPAHCASPPPDSTLQVLHWWTSDSERKAATVLSDHLAEEGVVWRDAGIPGGAGIGAGKVLKTRVLASDAPEVTQIIGASIKEWADLGFLLELDKVAAQNKWNASLFPTIQSLIQHRKHVMAAPLGIHRINTLFYNRSLFARLNLTPPESWNDMVAVSSRLKETGVTPLAQSSEPWQVATLFENLVLAESGPAFHAELFVRLNPQALMDPRFTDALARLRQMKSWMGESVKERPWPAVARQFANHEAAMIIGGDWIKGELNDWGYATDDEFSCIPMPGTGKYHLYSVDTLSMFANDYSHVAAQEKLAQLIVTPAVQTEYNGVKGSVSVRRDADPAKMDSCARASWTVFGEGSAVQAPSLVHRMATDESSKDAIIAVIHRFFVDDAMAPAEAQRRLTAIFRTLNSGASR